MAIKESRLPILSVSDCLKDLDKKSEITLAAIENKNALDFLIFTELEKTVARFNSLKNFTSRNAPLFEIMPETKRLFDLLGNQDLLLPSEINPWDFRNGVKEAKPLMLMGQEIKKGKLIASPQNKELAIGTPSINTHPLSLATGIALHLYERTVFSHMRKLNPDIKWKKDDILFALEEVILLSFAEGEIPGLLRPIVNSPEMGGLGWRTPKQVKEFIDSYNTLAH